MSTSHPYGKNRVPVSLDHKLDHKLISYTAAASAAGVALIALAQPSRAEVVYSPTYRTISQGGSVALDLNHDGKTDFTIHSSFGTCSSVDFHCWIQQLEVIPSGQNRVFATYGDLGGIPFARALSSGAKIGWAAAFSSGRLGYAAMDHCKATLTSYYLVGAWPKQKNRYVGLEFTIVHFGWARLSLPIEGGHQCHASPVLTGYAYETVPNQPILAGATSGTKKASHVVHPEARLGPLALGSAGLTAWRREEE